MSASAALTATLVFRKGSGPRVGAERIALLEAVRDRGSITSAARTVGLSYKAAWDAIQAINNLFDQPLVAAQAGGRLGGVATVTDEGNAVIVAFHAIEAELGHIIDAFERRLGDPAGAPLKSLFWSLGMKTSARNALRGVIVSVTEGAVNAEVLLKVAEGVEVVAIITRQSVEDLGLAPGRAAIALIKASEIILASDNEALRTSARNHLRGTIVRIEDGAVNSEITIELEAGKTLTATITLGSRQSMAFRVGQSVAALIKASHVILALE